MVLPELTNPANPMEILEGYEAIDPNGQVVAGRMPDYSGIVEQAYADLENQRIMVPRGFHDGFTGLAIQVEGLDVKPSDTQQVFYPTEGNVIGKVTVAAAQGGGNDVSIADASYLFAENRRLAEMDTLLPLCNAPENMQYMFYNSDELERVDLSGVDTSKSSSMKNSFSGCTNLAEIVGLSSVNSAFTVLDVPNGTDETSPSPLRRLVFRTDMPENVPVLCPITDQRVRILYCSFTRDGLVELFESLPNLNTEVEFLTVHQLDTELSSELQSAFSSGTYPCLIIDANGIKYPVTISAVITYARSPNSRNYLADENGTKRAPALPFTIYATPANSTYGYVVSITGNPGCADLQDSDRLLVTDKGWLLVE